MGAKIIIRGSNPKKDGRIPLALQVHANARKYLKTLYHILPDQWDGSKVIRHPDRDQINTNCHRELMAINEYLINCRLSGDKPDPDHYWYHTAPSGGAYTIMDAVIDYLLKLEDGQQWRARKRAQSVIGKLQAYDITTALTEISYTWMLNFENYLKKKYQNKSSTRHRDLGVIKAAINHARRCGKIQYNPVQDYTIPIEKPVKEKLTQLELDSIRSLPITGLSADVRNIFMWCIYNRGMRIGDALSLRWDNIRSGRLLYRMSKSGRQMDIKIIPQAQDILDQYEQLGGVDHIFPFMRGSGADQRIYLQEIENKTVIINKYLKKIATQAGITKNISTHIARHTFASMMDRSGMSITNMQHLLGHSSASITDSYIRDLRKSDELDDIVDGMF
jgi:integrase